MEPRKRIFLGIAVYAIFLILLVIFLGDVLAFDNYIFSLVKGLNNPYAEEFFGIVTNLGSSVFWILAIILFWIKKKKKLSLQLFFAFVIDTVLLAVLKFTFLRPRPFQVFDLGFDVNIGPSFPSGHTERAFSGALILSHHYKKYAVLFYSLSILVAVSRIYLGLHFPLDVVIGAVNGLIIGALTLLIPTKRIEKRVKN